MPSGWAAAAALAPRACPRGSPGARAAKRRRRAHSSCSCGGSAAIERVVPLDQPELGGAAGRAEIVEELDVGRVVVLPLLGGVVLVEDRLDRADRLTGTAVDAFVGVDVQHPLALVDAVDRALLDAGLVLEVDTRLRDDVGHAVVPRVHDAYPRSASSIAPDRSSHEGTSPHGRAVPDRTRRRPPGERWVVRHRLADGSATDVIGWIEGCARPPARSPWRPGPPRRPEPVLPYAPSAGTRLSPPGGYPAAPGGPDPLPGTAPRRCSGSRCRAGSASTRPSASGPCGRPAASPAGPTPASRSAIPASATRRPRNGSAVTPRTTRSPPGRRWCPAPRRIGDSCELGWRSSTSPPRSSWSGWPTCSGGPRPTRRCR